MFAEWPVSSELRASDNELTSLPESIGRLSRLRELHLRNNKLTSLPESTGELRELGNSTFAATR